MIFMDINRTLKRIIPKIQKYHYFSNFRYYKKLTVLQYLERMITCKENYTYVQLPLEI